MSVRNIDRFRQDLDRLTKLSTQLEIALEVRGFGMEAVEEAFKGKLSRAALENLPPFNRTYEAWYSECIPLIRQLLPDRLDDFREHFEPAKNRKSVTNINYRIQDALKGVSMTRFDGEVLADARSAIPHMRQQAAILKAAERRFDSSLFEIRQLVQADLFDTELGAAKELLKNKFVRAAGAIAGVVLEKHLAQICEDRGIKISKKHPGISDLNEALKSAGVIEVASWRHLSFLGDIRNLYDHNKQREPTVEQVHDLIEGVDKILKTIS